GDGPRNVCDVVRGVAGSPVLLPVASGTFPVSPTVFPRPSCTLSFLPPTSGGHDAQGFPRVRASTEQVRRDKPARTAGAAANPWPEISSRPASNVSPRPRRGACFATNAKHYVAVTGY